MLRRVLKNHSGMSLVEVLIAAGLLGGLSLIIAQISTNQSRMQKTALANQDINQISSLIDQVLNDGNNCNLTLSTINNNLPTALALTNDPVDLSEIRQHRTGTSYTPVIAAPSQLGKISVTAITARRPTGTDGNLENQVEFRISFQKEEGTLGGRTFDRTFIKTAEFDNNGQVTVCSNVDFPETVAKFSGENNSNQDENADSNDEESVFNADQSGAICGMLGGIFNPDTQKCESTELHTQICSLNAKVMGMNNISGDVVAFDPSNPNTNICDGWTVIIEDQIQNFTYAPGNSSHTFTVPNNLVPGSLVAKLIGGGGGGAAAKFTFWVTNLGNGTGQIINRRGCQGKASVQTHGSFAVLSPGTVCSITVGSQGSGGSSATNPNGNPGGQSSITCSGFNYTSQGGSGGNNSTCSSTGSNSAGENGQSSSFLGVTLYGGIGGAAYSTSNPFVNVNGSAPNVGQWGAGGGGGSRCTGIFDDADQSASCPHATGLGGDGAPGHVRLDYKVFTINQPGSSSGSTSDDGSSSGETSAAM